MHLVLGLLAISVTVYAQVTCPDNTWTRLADGSSCYKRVTGANTIRNCANACQNQQASLPCVNNAAEDTAIRNQFTTMFWLGLYQAPGTLNPANANFNRWADGCTSTYAAFASGQPADNVGQESCSVNNFGGTARGWDDVTCRAWTADCVCEFPGQNTATFFNDLSVLEAQDSSTTTGTATTPSPPTSNDDDDSSISSGGIAGIAVGGGVCLCLICIGLIAAIILAMRKRHRRPKYDYDYAPPPPAPYPMVPNSTPVLYAEPAYMEPTVFMPAGPPMLDPAAYGYY